MNKKFLSVPFEIKEICETKADGENFGIIKGYGSTFGNVDKGSDRVIKGAFVKTLAKYKEASRQIRMYWQHDFKNVIGGFEKYKEDSKGLYVEGKINLNVQKGAEAYALAKQGVMTDFSIGYYVKDYAVVEEVVGEVDGNEVKKTIWELKELDLAEISLVSNPMNDQAIMTDIKSCESITDISKLLKCYGISNKQCNEIIHFIKNIPRNENVKDIDDDLVRNELDKKINDIKLAGQLDNLINNIKRGL